MIHAINQCAAARPKDCFKDSGASPFDRFGDQRRIKDCDTGNVVGQF